MAVDRLGLDLGAHRVTISVMLMRNDQEPSGEPSRGMRDAGAYLLMAIGITIIVAVLVSAMPVSR